MGKIRATVHVLVRFIRLRVRGLDTFAGHVDGDAGEREVRAE